MSERLCSVGLDVGTTSTQLIVSELTVENQASAFSVPRMEIGERNVRYRSPVYFTPLLDESHVDGQKIREIVDWSTKKRESPGIRWTPAPSSSPGKPAGRKTPGRFWMLWRIWPGILWWQRQGRIWKVSWQPKAPGGGIFQGDGKAGGAHGHRRRNQQPEPD